MQDDQEFNIRFVRLVEAYPCLYDKNRKDYHVTHVQERAWAKIANDVGEGATIPECKSRWKNLRGSFTKHLKHVRSKSGTAKRPYYLAEYLNFILPFTKTRQDMKKLGASRTYDTFHDVVFKEELDCYDDSEWVMNDTDEEQSIMEDVSQVESSNQQDLETNESLDSKEGILKRSISNSSELQGENDPKRNKISHHQVTLEDLNMSDFENFEKENQVLYRPPDSTNDDPDMQFLLSLLPDFKKMTDKQKRKFKLKILSLADQILDESAVPHTSVTVNTPESHSYTSDIRHSMPSSPSSTACSNYVQSGSTKNDGQPTSFQDISFSKLQLPPAQDPLSNIQCVYENKV